LRSFSLSWTKGEYKILAGNIPYYLRVHHLPGRGTVLLGQQKYGDQFFGSKIEILSWKNDRYVPAEPLTLPEGLTVYDFVLLESGKTGSMEILHINRFNRLLIVSEKGKARYASKENYGGTLNLIRGVETNTYGNIRDEEKLTFYIPARLLVTGQGDSGKKEFILNRNKGSFFNFLDRYKAYNSGEVYSLSWEGGSLKEMWRTPVIPDYIANYNVGGFKNNGQKQLVIGVVQSTGPIPVLTDARSILYVYELGMVIANPK
jgi:hypothetical protein